MRKKHLHFFSFNILLVVGSLFFYSNQLDFSNSIIEESMPTVNVGCEILCNVIPNGSGGFTNSISTTADAGQCGAQLTIPPSTIIGCSPPGTLTNLLTEDFSGGSLPSGWSLSFNGLGGSTTAGTCGSSLFAFDCPTSGVPIGSAGNVAKIDDNAAGSGTLGEGCIETAAVNLSAYNSTNVSFDYLVETVTGFGHLKVLYWNGTIWIPFFNTEGLGDTNGHFEGCLAATNSDFKLRFCFNDDGAFSFGAALDNITVDGSTATVATPTNDFNNTADASDFYPVGVTNILWTVVDPVTGSSFTCMMNVTVTDDEKPEIPNCPMDISVGTDANICGAVVTWADIMTSDNCSFMMTGNKASGDVFSVGTTVVMLTATDPASNDSTCVFEVKVIDDTPPKAECKDINISLDVNGALTLTPQQIDDGSSDNCGTVNLNIDKSTFVCANVGYNDVELIVSDLAGNTAKCTAIVGIIASAICPDPDFLNSGGPTIADPCTCRGNNEFSEEVIIKSLIRQEWEVASGTLLNPAGMAPFVPFPTGTMLDNNPAGSGDYSLVGLHLDSVGYDITVESFFYPNRSYSISNICYYPDPIINDLDGPICLYTPPIPLVSATEQMAEGTGVFKINGEVRTIFDPMEWGTGIQEVTLIFDAGDPAGLLFPSDVGCIDSTTMDVEIIETPDEVACNDLIQVSVVPDDCYAIVHPDQLLEGTYLCYDDYKVEIKYDFFIGDSIPEEALYLQLGYEVTHLPSGNQCWGLVYAEDKIAPTLFCQSRTVDCSTDLTNLSKPFAQDNCDLRPIVYLIEEEYLDNDICDNDTMLLKRTFQAVDNKGNESDFCMDTITVTRKVSEIDFPEDVIVTCSDYNDDMTGEILLPEKRGGAVQNVSDGACKVFVDYSDEKILTDCNNFKIKRTWTVYDWCTNLPITIDQNGDDNIQIIKVLDTIPPEFEIQEDIEVNANLEDPSSHGQCASTQFLPGPIVMDDCNEFIVRIFTPVGELEYQNGIDGKDGGNIPLPGLKLGTHEINYRAIDSCGNQRDSIIEIEVKDLEPPVPICVEFTQISISLTPNAALSAEELDAASYDNCFKPHVRVRRYENSCLGESLDRSRFRKFINFCCEDVGDTVMVVLRVYDVNPQTDDVSTSRFQENANDCMVRVLVEDKLRPDCVAPEDVWINCDEVPDNIDWEDDILLDDKFGSASVSDNCNADLEYVRTTLNLDLCGIGNVTRIFRARDDYDNLSIGSCRQLIMIQPVIDYCITFPEDFEDECKNNNTPNDLIFAENGCDLLAISKEEEPFNAGGSAGDECKKVLRTWKVINWCEYDGISTPTVISRDGNGDGQIDAGQYCSTGSVLVYVPNPTQINYPSTGYYSWEQHVKIFDNTAPEIAYNGDLEFCGGEFDENPCTGQVDITLDITEMCTANLMTNWSITNFSDTFNSADASGSGSISGRLPLGTHTARFAVTDDCGNTSQLDVTFTVIDCKAPTPVCHNGLSIDVMPASGMVELWAQDFDASSFDYCHSLQFAVNRITDSNNDGFITEDDYIRTPPVFDSIQLTCGNVDQLTMVQLWAGELSGDGNNDWDFCVTFIEVQDNNDACGISKTTLTGNISNEKGNPVKGVELSINAGNNSIFSDESGNFNFDNLTVGEDYSIAPFLNSDVSNEVSTFDLAIISKHILSVKRLESPYQMIAADANNSKSISTLDLVAIRKVVLRSSNNFPNNSSWRFVDKDYIFPNPNNPWQEVFPEVININNLDLTETHRDFVAIKVGDVNSSFVSNRIGSLPIYFKKEKVGEFYEIQILAKGINFEGGQFSIEIEKPINILSGQLKEENWHYNERDNALHVSWNGLIANEGEPLFTFKIKGNQTLNVSQNFLSPEGYLNESVHSIQLVEMSGENSEFQIFQNFPNPFQSMTTLPFFIENDAETTILIYNELSQETFSEKKFFKKGLNHFKVNCKGYKPGVYFYTIKTSEETGTRKMILNY